MEWRQKHACGLGGCLSWRSGLLRHHFCWGYLWLQVVIWKGQGSFSPEFKIAPTWGSHCHLSATNWGWFQPQKPWCPAPSLQFLLQNRSGWVCAQSMGFRQHRSGKLFAELAGGGLLGRGPRESTSGAKPMASSEMVEGSAQSLGCGDQINPLC